MLMSSVPVNEVRAALQSRCTTTSLQSKGGKGTDQQNGRTET